MIYNVGNLEFQTFALPVRNAAVALFQHRGGDQGGFHNGLKHHDFMGRTRFFVYFRKNPAMAILVGTPTLRLLPDDLYDTLCRF
jgi:hypothetical protein